MCAMSLGGSSTYLKSATMLEQLLEEINFQRTKEMRQLMKDESGFVVLQGTTYWTDLFVRHFLFQEEQAIDCDDLLFFVRKRHVKGSSRYLPKYETDVEVFRKDSKKLPIGDPEIDWEETVYLNLIVHQFDYTLTLAICTRTSPKELQVLKRHSQKVVVVFTSCQKCVEHLLCNAMLNVGNIYRGPHVYASPSRRKMDTKGEGEEMTYPHICFMVDNFDEVFCDIVVRDGEMVCVELVARGRGGAAQAVIFLGSIRYDALTRVYDNRQTSLSTKVAQRMSFGLLGGKAAGRCEFVRMKGPSGKGHAEMAVSRPHAAGLDTPTSEPGLSATDMWDSDWDEDPEEMFIYRHQRRLSDPSANITNFVRGGWRTREPKDKSRSENEGLDALVDGLAEVEAGDLRDESRRGSQASSAGAGAGWTARMVHVCARAPDVSSPACLHVVCARAPARSPARSTPALRPLPGHCELGADAAAMDDTALGAANPRTVSERKRRTVRGKEELPWEPDCQRRPRSNPVVGQNQCAPDVTRRHTVPSRAMPSAPSRLSAHLPPSPAPLAAPEDSRLEGDDTRGVRLEGDDTRGARLEGDNTRGARLERDGTRGANSGARAYVTLPRRRRGVADALFRGARLPPARTTPDGTDIYYWCDLPKHARRTNELDDGAYNPLWAMRGFTQTFHLWKEGKRQQSAPLNAFLTYVTLPWWSIAKELDDGAYNPLWAMRGFTQTFHLWKEGKRQQSAPLNAFLTYVTLPWWSIAKDILDHREEPILTF